MKRTKVVMVVAGALLVAAAGWCAAGETGKVRAEKAREHRMGKGMFGGPRRLPPLPGLKEEMERFRKEQKELWKEVKKLREKVREELKNAGDVSPEKKKEIVEKYKDEAKELALKMVNARIGHMEKILAILREGKSDLAEKMANRFLAPHRKGRRGRKGCPMRQQKKEGKGRETSSLDAFIEAL